MEKNKVLVLGELWNTSWELPIFWMKMNKTDDMMCYHLGYLDPK